MALVENKHGLEGPVQKIDIMVFTKKRHGNIGYDRVLA